ncbi:MAG: Fe-S protein assembly co-chaperone HscB [Zoogloeaceae bacterium]|nr:Fe-S protein assembly co-chaperone HscB [Zoogloeaceae bacterium]
MVVDLRKNHYELFGLPVSFRIDGAELDRAYREVQGQVHPDRFAHLSDLEKRVSMQWATRVNEAYRVLRTPLSRACYLLELQGVDPALESNTAMSPEFLMEQMEWREAVADARDSGEVAELEVLQRRIRGEAKALDSGLEDALDRRHALEDGRDLVRRMMFLTKLQHEIDNALEALES